MQVRDELGNFVAVCGRVGRVMSAREGPGPERSSSTDRTRPHPRAHPARPADHAARVEVEVCAGVGVEWEDQPVAVVVAVVSLRTVVLAAAGHSSWQVLELELGEELRLE